jgi:two-component system LytT family sensor kinase
MTATSRNWLLGAAIWTLFPFLVALQAVVYGTYVGAPVDWTRVLSLRLADWYTCAAFTPVAFWLVRRNLLVQLAAIPMAVVVKYAIYVELARLLRPSETWSFTAVLARSFASESIALGAVLAIVHGIEAHRRYRERELHTARLEAELASARLDALTAQLQPHFLFNTLNSISTLMRRDVDAAEEMLAHLGTLLHRTLRSGERHEVTLAEELELLEQYLAIMKIRFQDRLVVRKNIDAGVTGASVPQLVLQPLVENAIRHGISRRPGAGLIEIAASRLGQSLEITVRDDGDGLVGDAEGIGLTNTRRRLRQLYGDAQALELAPAAEGGLRVTLRLPIGGGAAILPVRT